MRQRKTAVKADGLERKRKAADVLKIQDPKPKVVGSAKAELQPGQEREHSVGSNSVTRATELRMSGFETIIDSVFTFDPEAAYEEVIAGLTLSGKASATSYGELVDALDVAEDNARKALQLVAKAKVTCARFITDSDILRAELHQQATSELLAKFEDPSDRTVTKKPTVADIEAYKITTYYDEWADLESKTQEAKRTVDYLEGLASLTSQRARDLRQMVAGSRGA